MIDDPERRTETKLPRRDWILLPLLCLITIVFLTRTTEHVAQRMFSESKTGVERCWVLNDPSTGVRGIPNSICWEKNPEAKLIEYKFNACGHRAGMECGTRTPDTFRIVMAGSSFAMGMRVPREQTLAALLPGELSQQTGRKVELYNEGMGDEFTHTVALRFNDVLAAKPDMILWVLTPMDIQQAGFVVPHRKPSEESGATKRLVKEALALPSAWDKVRGLAAVVRGLADDRISGMHDDIKFSRTGFLLQHYLYESQSLYVESFLKGNDAEAGFLKSQQSEMWQSSLQQADADAAYIAERAQAAGIPLVAVPLPNRAQAAMISMGEWPAGYDPYKLDDELRAIIERHGGIYVDILPDFRKIPNPEQHYLPIDGHPDADGHAIMTRLLTRALTEGAVPQLKAADGQRASLEQGR